MDEQWFEEEQERVRERVRQAGSNPRATVRLLFDRYDKNHDGVIDIEEFKQLVSNLLCLRDRTLFTTTALVNEAARALASQGFSTLQVGTAHVNFAQVEALAEFISEVAQSVARLVAHLAEQIQSLEFAASS